jgi:transposase
MSDVNATCPRGRGCGLARLIVEQGWTYTAAAKMFMVLSRTAAKWNQRYPSQAGRDG